MNGRIAKKLRKLAFEDRVTKASARRYRKSSSGIVCIDDRATYQDLKKDYYSK